MKMPLPKTAAHARQSQAMAVLVVISLLAIISLYVMLNARTLHYLKRDLSLVEQKQIRRLSPPPAATLHTNRPPDGLPRPAESPNLPGATK